ncbi:hypothetical protein GCM10007901_35860 [Dyella acidisoli]|uniref:Uncharacterized protein n=1 Tax=Dyella acidisoli TaxID=1867834 RepID=A0ABQ5XSE0_9GAMM|nr:hypothetical protein GCM10007901_35860 [Dyella acidisoli]
MMATTTINSTTVNPAAGLRCVRIVLMDRPRTALDSCMYRTMSGSP